MILDVMLINPDIVIASVVLACIGSAVLLPELLHYKRSIKLQQDNIGFFQRLLLPFGLATAERKALADLLPWKRLVRHDIIKNYDGSYSAAWRVAGADIGTLNDEDILNTAYHIAATIGSSLPNTKIQMYARRAPFREYEPGLGLQHPISQLLDATRAHFFLKTERVYQTERTIVLTWSPPSDRIERLRAAVSVGVDAQIRSEDEILAEFHQLCDVLETAFTSRTLTASRLGQRKAYDAMGTERCVSDLVSFLNMCITGFHLPLVAPTPSVNLSDHLAVEVRGGYEPKIGELETSAIIATTYPPQAVPCILDRLTELKISHLLHISFVPQPIVEATQQLSAGASDFKAAANFSEKRHVDQGYKALHEQMVDALGQTHGDYTRYGYISFTIIVRGRTRADVRRAESVVQEGLNACMFRGTVRRAGAMDTFMSVLPGQMSYGKSREYLMDALTVAKVFPIHEMSLGRKYAESESFAAGLKVPPVTYALGPGGQFFRKHLNVKDVFHSVKFGRPGIGKSVDEAYESGMFITRLPHTGVTIIDRGPSAYQICKMFDGQYYKLLGKGSPGFALFSDVHIPAQSREVFKIVKRMCELSGVTVDGKREQTLKDAIRVIGTRPKKERSFFAFWEQLQDFDETLRPALKKYTRLGDVESTFDCVDDTFETGRFNVIDVELAMNLAPALLIPILEVIIWKTRTAVRRMKEAMGVDGNLIHWRFAIDEFNNSFMRHPIGAQFAEDLLLMGRKENFSLSLATNSIRGFAEWQGCSNVMLAAQTRVYFNDPSATGENRAYYEGFELPERGIRMLTELKDFEFILHQPEANVMRRLSHRLDKNMLAILGTSRSVARVDEYITRFPVAQYGKHRWKVELLQAQGAKETADLLMNILKAHEKDTMSPTELRFAS